MRANPKGIRTADFIFERKGVYKMFDLKTITGRSSVDNRLIFPDFHTSLFKVTESKKSHSFESLF